MGNLVFKSAYHVACQIEQSPVSDPKQAQNWWRTLWQAQILNKIKVFAWQVCMNALPTSSNLNRRLQNSNLSCPYCGDSQEDILHVLLYCPFTRQVWGLSNLSGKALQNNTTDGFCWIKEAMLSFDGTDRDLFLTIC
ncbi:UNVERIFIED_CONTAM: hypothetical protein Sradi_2030100 [Sesamum radiatum]|uniref:Reverse transcriptase zinc-binding domain-containing protein n=1 Tax=Sesamum radiatum TaxID=300843 RepID=A0AAW2TI80_SESRA